MNTDVKLADLPMRHLVALYGLYIISRCMTSFVDNDFSVEMFTGSIQYETYGLKFSYIFGTLLHPIIFAYLVVEFGANKLPKWFANLVIFSHFASIMFVFFLTIENSIGCSTNEFGSPSIWNCFGKYYYFHSDIFKADVFMPILFLFGSAFACYFSLNILNKEKPFFISTEAK